MSKEITLYNRLLPLVAFARRQSTALAERFEHSDKKVAYSVEITNPTVPLRRGGLIILITFGFFGTWAALAPLDSAAVAPGLVMVESNRRTIQHLEGGIVRDILVQDGSKVKAGDVLIRLEDVRARAQLAIMENDLDSQLAAQARLLAEQNNLASITFPAELTGKNSDPAVAAILNGQENQFRARSESIRGQKAILEERIEQYREQIVGLKALQTSKEAQLGTIREELKDLSGLLTDGYVTKSRVLALQREEARLEGESGDHIASIARSEQGIGEAKLQIFQIDKTHQEDVAKELRDIDARVSEDREKVVAASDVMRRIDVTSPVNGTVMNLQVHTQGGVVNPGAAMMEVVPDDDSLIAEINISPMDIDTIHQGDTVAIHVSAVDSRLTPVIYGKLETISADRVTDQRTGAPYYRGRVVISPQELSRLGPDHPLHSGMSVEAMVNRGSQTALHYALKPLVESLGRSFREK